MSTVGLDPHTIFAYDTHRNVPWNVLEYQPVRNYEDPQRAITERKVSNGEATYKRPPTKKGFYLDQHVKNVKDIPSPCISISMQPNTLLEVVSTKPST